MVTYILMVIIAYAIGSINFSVIFSKKFAGFDVREKGSGNAGTTNMLRSVGKKAALITLICDILKGVAAVLIAILIGNVLKDLVLQIVTIFNVDKTTLAKWEELFTADKAILVQLAGFFVVFGHTFPIFFGFKGGKGVATALGILLLMNWQIGLICLSFGIVLIVVTRMVSLGSIMAAILYPILTIFIHDNYIVEGNYVIFGIILAILVIFNHRSNIKRLMNGTENKISLKK